MSHSFHPDSHTHGLADGCERCAEHAENPFASLDQANLRALVTRSQLWMRDDPNALPRSENEHRAMAVVERAVRQAQKLHDLGVDFGRVSAMADTLEIDGDEDGWHLKVVTDEDVRYDFRIHSIAWDFADQVDKTIAAEQRFAESCRGTGPPRITEDDLNAYPLGDPKRITLEREMRRQQ